MAAAISKPDILPLFLSQLEIERRELFVLEKDNEFFLFILAFDCGQANHLWLILYLGFFTVR